MGGLRGHVTISPFRQVRIHPVRPSAPGRAQGAAGFCFEPIEKCRRAERATDRLGRADGGQVLRRRASVEEIGEAAGRALDRRRDRGEAVAAPLQMRAHEARPT
jgi:hypothetical protein